MLPAGPQQAAAAAGAPEPEQGQAGPSSAEEQQQLASAATESTVGEVHNPGTHTGLPFPPALPPPLLAAPAMPTAQEPHVGPPAGLPAAPLDDFELLGEVQLALEGAGVDAGQISQLEASWLGLAPGGNQQQAIHRAVMRASGTGDVAAMRNLIGKLLARLGAAAQG